MIGNEPNKPSKKPSTKGIVSTSRRIAGSLEDESKAIEEALNDLSRSSQKDIVESMDMFRDILKDIDREAQKNNVNFNKIQKTLSEVKQEAIRIKETTENTFGADITIIKSLETIINKFKDFEKQVKQVKTRTENYNKTLQQSASESLATADSIKELANNISELEQINRGAELSVRELLKTSSDFVTSKKIRQAITLQSNALSSLESLTQSLELDFNKIDKQLKTSNDAVTKLENELKNTNLNEELIPGLELLVTNLKAAIKATEEYKILLDSITSLKVANFTEQFTKDVPVLGKGISKVTGVFREGLQESLKNGETDLGKLRAAGFKSLGKAGLLGAITMVVEQLFQVNQEITDIQKNFGLSAGKAQVLRAEISTAAASSGDLFITTEKLLASFTALSSQLGFQVTTSGQLLETFTNLEQRFGLGATEAANLTSILGLTNKNSEDLLGNTIKTINRSRDSNKLFNNTKLILKDVADASAGTVVALGRSPDLLAKAAVKARELGISLGQVEKIADSLLNFESSIEAELKAELLTGKQLNLERARFLALNNDLIGLQEELNKQNINFAEYTQMSRIGQQALAESLGMGREEMSQMLFNQEKQLLAQKATRGELEGQTLAQFKALSAQQKFEASVEKVKNLFSSIVSFLSPFIDFAAKIADILAKITGFFQIGADAFSAGTMGKSIEARAMGGPVSSGSPYIVGEKGPELFVPGSSGQIVNNSALSNMSSPSINLQPLVERLDRLEKTLVEYRSVPVVIENRLDGDAFLRNTLRGNRRGNPAIVVPSVYTGGLT
jgi:hypothetical protein